MRVLHVIPSLSLRDGGPSFALPLIAKGLQLSGVQVDIATTVAPQEKVVDHEGLTVFQFQRQSEFYKVALQLSRWLSNHVRKYDLVHIHALFSYSSYAAARQAARNEVPYIVRPLGVLNRWGMQNRRRMLKRFSFHFIEQRIMSRAAAIHYTSEQEKIEAKQTGVIINDAAVIPLAVDLSAFRALPGPDVFHDKFPSARGRQVILFLSRLDPKKGLDLLLRAFAELKRRKLSTTNNDELPLLVIAGDGEQQFVAGLHRTAYELGIADDMLWVGFLDGNLKLSALSTQASFVLPSYSENFGIALVEAMAAGLPCVMSDQIGLAADAGRYDAAIVVPCDTESLASAIDRLLNDVNLRRRLISNANRLIEERFSIEVMSNSLIELYNRVLCGETGQPTAIDYERGQRVTTS